jgi:hypothetical protein
MRVSWVVMCLLLTTSAQAEVYRCPQGKTTVFSDTPCDDKAQPYQARNPIIIVPHEKAPDLSRQFDERIAREKKAIKAENAEWNKAYKLRKSDEARFSAARIQGKVVRGMDAEEVRRLLGEPTEISRDEDAGNPHETWTYLQGREKTQVYFKAGVVTRTYAKKSRR